MATTILSAKSPDSTTIRSSDDQREGHGQAAFQNGDVYDGEYKNGVRHGRGIYRFASGATYDGEYVDGKKQGYGVFTYRDGSKYIGEWRDDKREGWGEYHYENGDHYVGQWLNHNRHGRGTYTYRSASVQYEGNWDQGQRSSDGRAFVTDMVLASNVSSLAAPSTKGNHMSEPSQQGQTQASFVADSAAPATGSAADLTQDLQTPTHRTSESTDAVVAVADQEVTSEENSTDDDVVYDKEQAAPGDIQPGEYHDDQQSGESRASAKQVSDGTELSSELVSAPTEGTVDQTTTFLDSQRSEEPAAAANAATVNVKEHDSGDESHAVEEPESHHSSVADETERSAAAALSEIVDTIAEDVQTSEELETTGEPTDKEYATTARSDAEIPNQAEHRTRDKDSHALSVIHGDEHRYDSPTNLEAAVAADDAATPVESESPSGDVEDLSVEEQLIVEKVEQLKASGEDLPTQNETEFH